ncbi:MAG: gamma-glutamylcyclotransferase [Desulfobacterales bacterium]|nr:gamma-glutamylcyclotransferase [Desulfobacterales bacterium]
MPECPKYVFGYGSLMHPESAFKTLSSQQQEFIPARLTGYRRTWTAITHNRLKIETADGKIPTFLAYMNIEKDLEDFALGVIISVSDDDIKALDVREEMYIRLDVTDHIGIINEKKWNLPENARVFTYISFSSIPKDQFENDTAIRNDYIQLIENASKQIDEKLGELKLFQDDFSRVNKSVKNWPKLDVPEKIDEGRYKVSDPVRQQDHTA